MTAVRTLPGTLARSSAGMVSVKLKMCHQLARSTDASTCMWRRRPIDTHSVNVEHDFVRLSAASFHAVGAVAVRSQSIEIIMGQQAASCVAEFTSAQGAGLPPSLIPCPQLHMQSIMHGTASRVRREEHAGTSAPA